VKNGDRREMERRVRERFPRAQAIEQIRGEASLRRFFRLTFRRGSRVAMVYPSGSQGEVERVLHMSALYARRGLPVPRVVEAGQGIILLEDLGDLSLQRLFRRGCEADRKKALPQIVRLLGTLSEIPVNETAAILDKGRLDSEMAFFLDHFLRRHPPVAVAIAELRSALGALTAAIDPPAVFAHRDFHSRNMLWCNGRLYLVDFQDSLVAPRFYDLVSFAYDSYLELGPRRQELFCRLAESGWVITGDQVRLTALQRNIKALGTFAFQIHERGRGSYARYIPRTVSHIMGHLRELRRAEFDALRLYFRNCVIFPRCP